jgi:hypothetical protein
MTVFDVSKRTNDDALGLGIATETTSGACRSEKGDKEKGDKSNYGHPHARGDQPDR